MDNIAWILGIIAVILGGGWAYSSHKNRQIRQYEEKNRELARESAEAVYAETKARQKSNVSDAGKNLQAQAYNAVLNQKKSSTDSSTPLSEEDRKLAKDIMDNHRP